MLDSDCTDACAFNGLPWPMRHWFTGITHSLQKNILSKSIKKHKKSRSGNARPQPGAKYNPPIWSPKPPELSEPVSKVETSAATISLLRTIDPKWTQTWSSGKTYGKPSANMECPITCSKFCAVFVIARWAIWADLRDKDVNWILSYFPVFWRMLAPEGWQCRCGFSRWHAIFPFFAENVWRDKFFVGRTGDM